MKSAIRYELKRILLPLVVFLACAAVIAVAYCAIADLESPGYGHIVSSATRLYDSTLGVYCAILCILATVAPVLQFSYRMKQRSVDLWYSLPITRKQLTLVRIIGGLVMTLAPFALAYWLGIAVVAIRGAHFDYIWYLPAFFALLLAGAALFLVNAFLFTRGNSVFDGIFFMLLWCCLLPVVFTSLNLGFEKNYLYYHGDNRINFDTLGTFLFSYSPAVLLTNVFSDFVLKDPFDSLSFYFLPSGGEGELEGKIVLIVALILPVVEGVLAFLGLTLFAEKDKAENASQVSSSWWGYRTLIPAYTGVAYAILFRIFAIGTFEVEILFFTALIAVGAFVLYFVYRHSFRLKKSDVLSVVFSMLGGIVYAYILFGICQNVWGVIYFAW